MGDSIKCTNTLYPNNKTLKFYPLYYDTNCKSNGVVFGNNIL
uniref:Uncharacterized protein n=1 Tax=Vitis vinifera TaxID=29760 RepID=F6HI13_VITVI